jgi:hypothetical protein
LSALQGPAVLNQRDMGCLQLADTLSLDDFGFGFGEGLKD